MTRVRDGRPTNRVSILSRGNNFFFSVFVIKFKLSLGPTQNIIEGVQGVIRVV